MEAERNVKPFWRERLDEFVGVNSSSYKKEKFIHNEVKGIGRAEITLRKSLEGRR